MSLRTQRNKTREAILNDRFVEHVLNKHAKTLDQRIKRAMVGFKSAFWNDRKFNVRNNILSYGHLPVHRFADMKFRKKMDGGRIRKKHYQIHNKPAFGVANEIVRELTFGFTDAIKSQLEQLDGGRL